MTHTNFSVIAHKSRRAALKSLLTKLLTAHAMWQHRQCLRTLDDATLHDIGLTRAEADAEAARPIWNAPDQWLR